MQVSLTQHYNMKRSSIHINAPLCIAGQKIQLLPTSLAQWKSVLYLQSTLPEVESIGTEEKALTKKRKFDLCGVKNNNRKHRKGGLYMPSSVSWTTPHQDNSPPCRYDWSWWVVLLVCRSCPGEEWSWWAIVGLYFYQVGIVPSAELS